MGRRAGDALVTGDGNATEEHGAEEGREENRVDDPEALAHTDSTSPHGRSRHLVRRESAFHNLWR
jgi:hypothetical protein